LTRTKFFGNMCDMESVELIEAAVAQLKARDPHTPIKVEDGRIWRYMGEGEGAHWIQYCFTEELYAAKGGIHARGFLV